MSTRPRHLDTRYKHSLTPRQRQVLGLIAAGKTNFEIAEALGVSLEGAKYHVREIMTKLQVDSREEAATWWRRYTGPRARISHTLAGLVGMGALKAASAAGGVAVLGAAVTAGVVTLREGPSTERSSDPPTASCSARDMRWDARAERVGDQVRISLTSSLRNPDWYEGPLHAIGIGDSPPKSPCILEADASITLFELAPPDDAHPNAAIPAAAIRDVSTSPSIAPVRVELRTGTATSILTGTFSNWCRSPMTIGGHIQIPALRPGGPPMTSTSFTLSIPDLPPCVDATGPVELSAAGVVEKP